MLFNLKNFLSPKPDVDNVTYYGHKANGKHIAIFPFNFRHEIKVHAIQANNESKG
jgi:hypothetical protein